MARIALFFVFLTTSAQAFEYVNEKKSFENHRELSLILGLGIDQLIHSDGVEGGNPGFLFQTGFGHRISQWFGADFIYQVSTFRFLSPDPIDPAANINTRTGLHKEYVRLKLFYPKVAAQPYIGVGFGGYQFSGLDGATALSISPNIFIPLSAGVQTFVYKNSVSLDVDFSYHLFFGEGQNQLTLDTLGLNKFSLNMFSLVGGFRFHFL